jgi:ankyrin repeat protein
MKINLINYFRKTIYLVVLLGFSVSYAGSYDDFFKALKMDDATTVNQLLARGFDANTLDPDGQHGLLVAIKEPSLKVAKTLVNAPKVNLNTINVLGESPLMLASLKGELELATQMVKKGADVNKTGWTPLHYAASNGHVPVIKLLLENYAYIDAESPNGTTPLMMASMYGSPESVKLLLDEGADPTLKNQQGLTALDFAQRGKRPDAIEMMTKAIRTKQATGKW